ncbi:hypothetical protein SeMB42_g07382 [Synchytrium endobioticum]|uniref:Carnitine O-acetyltransferase, mitochondrial n=1 Tax=Synchytrium endobioticum TaxID=286115 RepID=A0A507CLV9_9FUNG|nr:hypothetical protein SeMB42_g07382 [Synchytrium endobioticum]TPX39355.1 hypothetical protein SeLEV6574_g07278 [Synchytrium endobioticum]
MIFRSVLARTASFTQTRNTAILRPVAAMKTLVQSDPSKPMYKHQATMAKLPVPDLKPTCEKYLRSVRALVSDAHYQRTKAAVDEFLAPGGQGQVLQTRLLEHARHHVTDWSQVVVSTVDGKPHPEAREANTSWLLDDWNRDAYMAYRDPLVVNVSYFFVFKDVPKLVNNPARRAAELIKATLTFKKLVVEEALEVDMARGLPLSMDQFQWMFNTCRIPRIPSDVTRIADARANHHIIVTRNNKFFNVNMVHPDGRELSTAEIEAQLNKICGLAADTKGIPVGALTTQNRDVWAKVRNELLESPVNVATLDQIETASFLVALESGTPATFNETSRAAWVGDGKNRWWDTACQYLIWDTGRAGFVGEHSMMDGTPTNKMTEWVVDNLVKGRIDHGSSTSSATLPSPQQLQWQISPSVAFHIRAAEWAFEDLVSRHDLSVLEFGDFGKDAIKKMGLSPDAFVQMALQLGYYKMHGTCKPTYESAQVRKFAYGRTETCRSVSLESVVWVKAMRDPSLSVAQKADLGRRAIASHVAYMNDAVENKGCDRHLLGLRLQIRPGERKPAIFADPAYDSTRHWNLSTSQISSEHYNGYGWGEVVPDGYGVPYCIRDASLHITVTCLNPLRASLFTHHICESLREMRCVFEATKPAEAAKAKL